MNILFLGPPGSGKGTQSKMLQDRYALAHLSTGDMFREAIAKQTEVGLKAKGYMDRGEYVPDSVVIDLIRDRLQAPDCRKGFILDGFPRTEPQARALEHLLGEMKRTLDAVFYFDLSTDILVGRLSSRRTCRNCNRVVSTEQLSGGPSSGICSKTGTSCEFYQRSDDSPEVVRRRIEVYQTQTAPIIGFYEKTPGFLRVDGSASPDAVFGVLSRALDRV
ncbi:adenylate kinase [bacterium]|jgi:adenylate kinase|nr:adenylate kinase [bacterium]